ncbi:hypothetical protein [uncultured Brachybacterium sp.]|uniref:hypothetical protein n=1 Tax=uncultured Brachybacterium sp. TaxID=189680 RepID=UPI00262B6285|nr:hypothetical protein [uncultured Brachybacterium sp.]
MHTTTTITRYRAGLLALGALAALLAGCTTGPASAEDPAAAGGAGKTVVQEAPDQERSDVHDAAAPAAEDAEGAAAPDSEIPGQWDGTVSTERFAAEADGSYLAMMTLHGEAAVTTMSAEDIAVTEFLAGADAQCEGEAVLDGAAASCTFVAMDGSGDQQLAQVRLVPTGFGNTALLFGVTDEPGAALPVAPGAAQGLQTLGGGDVSVVTDEELAGAATSGILLGYRNDGELPADLSVTCEVSDGGEHGLCEVTGTPDGGGDGTWYASAQRGFDGDRAAYLFTQLPQE